MHVKESLGPALFRIPFTVPRRIALIAIVVVIEVRHRVLLEVEINGEAAHGLRDVVDAPAESRTDQPRVQQLQGTHGMCVRDDDVAGQHFPAVHLHADGVRVIADDACHLLPCQDLAAITVDGVHQGRGDTVTAAPDTEGTLVVEVHDESMGGERRLVFLCRIERKVAYEDLRKHRVGNHFVNDGIDGTQLIFRVQRSIRVGIPEGVERRGIGDILDKVVIPHEIVVLGREIRRHLPDEGFSAVGKGIPPAAQGHDIIAPGVELREPHRPVNLQVPHEPVQRLPMRGTADEVHACLELCATPGETLQAAPCLPALFQDGDGIAVLRQDDSRGQSAQSASDNDNLLLPCHCSILSAISSYFSL